MALHSRSHPNSNYERVAESVHRTAGCLPPANSRRVVSGGDGLQVTDVHWPAFAFDRVFSGRHAGPSVQIVRKGVFSYRVGGVTHTAGPGMIMLGNPGEEYLLQHECGLPAQRTLFEFGDGAAPDHLELSSAPPTTIFARPVLPPDPRIDLLHRLAWLAARHTGREDDAGAIGRAVAAIVVSKAGSAGSPPPAFEASQRLATVAVIWNLLRHIDENHATDVSLPILSEVAGRTPFHVVRLFHRVVGMAPYQYVIHTRLRRAIGLLLETTLPEAQIAEATSLGSVVHLTRLFRRHLGCRPADLRVLPQAELVRVVSKETAWLEDVVREALIRPVSRPRPALHLVPVQSGPPAGCPSRPARHAGHVLHVSRS